MEPALRVQYVLSPRLIETDGYQMIGAAQSFLAREQIFGVTVAPLRDDVRMFDEQQLVGNQRLLAPFDEILLDPERIAVSHAPEILHLKH